MSWLHILGALLFFGGCSVLIAPVHHCHEFTSAARARGCISNQSSLDKCVGVWESQNVALPGDRELWLELDTRGRITRVSDSVRELMDTWKIVPNARLAAGSEVLFNFTKDENVFRCPSRVHQVSELELDNHPETHFRFVSFAETRPELSDRKRGVICMLHHDVGPRDMSDAVHRWVPRE